MGIVVVQRKSKNGEGSFRPWDRTLTVDEWDTCSHWRLRVPTGYDHIAGKYRTIQKTFRGTETQAKRALARLLTEVGDGKVTADRCTFGQLTERVLASKKTRGRAPKTLYEYELHANWLNDEAGWRDRQVREITPANVDDSMDRAIEDRGQSSAAHAFRFARTCFRQAVAWDLLDRSPTDRATEVPEPESSGKAPTPQIVQRFIDGAELGAERKVAGKLVKFGADVELSALIFIASTTLLGPGELCALTKGNVDLRRGLISVEHSVSVVKGTRHVRDTKTKARKAPVALDPVTVEVLRRQLAIVEKRCKAMGVDFDDHRFLWSLSADHSVPMIPRTLSDRWGRLRKALGITGVRLYDLRHYGTTQGFALGVDPKTMQGRARHSDSKITLEVYADVLQANDFEAARLIAGTLTPPSETPALEPDTKK